MNALDKMNELIEYLSDADFFLCETKLQASTMSGGFVKLAKELKIKVEILQRDLLNEQRRYDELRGVKEELSREVQAARMYIQNQPKL